MKTRVGINGLGRIGRSVLRATHEIEKYSKQIEVIAVNGSLSAEQHAHLIKYDSVHGKFNGDISFNESENWISINGRKFSLYRERSPENLPWNVDVVLECTGAFNKRAEAAKHNAGKVIVSAPASGADVTIVYGVNNNMLKKEHKVISAGSCTTNCLAPVMKVLHSNLGIKSGFMTTVHAYTNDQNVLDGNHRDLRRARACGLSMVPTTTGAAKTIGSVIPELKGKLDSTAIRVPVANVSMVDLKFTTNKKVTAKEINEMFKNSVNDVLSTCEEPLVSIDFVHNSHSAIVDLAGTYVTGDICRVAAWYDNEWAFSLRMLDIALLCYNII
ncbi:type I glyceraldehyde-3-phosphate dehydrogenase [Wolbachia endosymbiont of Litomosoides brasiliensis]|uniref:type I glyceraldehyde-3-phosphate dehydrogenase n=1 Tax=Wolbachia endosymbiont of Litomosoides brasiliensis TaxID=1812117 RepID=UPI001589D05D|nr:type I glyceraldehyde-3-phosphate dehydrogenase [Wolbachia endosymbiont of Litomosoides brasiliensis]NUY39521.1 type I glyceraldehyde-3-phosphate dehydrogenase [Wolbachia endosymbiont of Litomosoides brasiliensis]